MTRRRLDRRASMTAQVAAAQRAAETLLPPDHRLLDDPYSRYFVRSPLLRACLIHRRAAGAFIGIIDRRLGSGFHAFIVLRARYTDDVCEAAIADGIDQLVLLGAGFDTTGLRSAQAAVTVFEVDAPTTQEHKRAVCEHLKSVRRNDHTVWVPCDFEHDALRERLLTHGFDPTRPSLIIWIGVSLYLTGAAIDTTVADLAALCAPGSKVVFDYIDPDVITGTTQSKGARKVSRTVERYGEPFRTGFTDAGVDALLAAHGFMCHQRARLPALLQRYAPTYVSGLAGNDWQTVATAQRI